MMLLSLLLLACTHPDTDTGEPAPLECEEGELLDGERCVPEACGLGPFGGLEADLYVDASSSGGQGTQQAPFSTISEALAAAGEGQSIAVAEGTYAENLLLEVEEVELHGRCAELVVVQGGGSPPVSVDQALGHSAFLADLTLTQGGVGAWVDHGGLDLRRVWLLDNSDGGLYANQRSQIHVEEVVVRGTETSATRPWGVGVFLEGGADLSGTDLLVEQVSGVGLLAGTMGSEVELEGLTVRGVAYDRDYDWGLGVLVEPVASLTATDVLVEDTVSTGILVDNGTLHLTRAEVRDTEAKPNGFNGMALALLGGAEATLVDSSLHDNHGGAYVLEGCALDLQDVSITANTTPPATEEAPGIVLTDAALTAVGLEISGSVAMGIQADGSQVVLEQATITDTELGDFPYAPGIQASDASVVSATDLELSGHHMLGLLASGEGTQLTLQDFDVHDLVENQDQINNMGICVQDGATVQATGGEVHDLMGVGVGLVLASGELHEVEVRDISSSETWEYGAGLFFEGSDATVTDCLVERFERVGIAALEGGEVVVEGGVVREGLGVPSQQFGHGVEVSAGATLRLNGLRVEDTRTAGVFAQGEGSVLVLDQVEIEGTQRGVGVASGVGALVHDQALMVASDTTLVQNTSSGVLVQGGRVELTDVEVRDTWPGSEEVENGLGVAVAMAGSAQLVRVTLSGNHAAGLAVLQEGSEAAAEDLLVEDMHPGANQTSAGVFVQQGASATLTRATIRQGEGLGLGVSVGGSLSCDGCTLEDLTLAGLFADGGTLSFTDGSVSRVTQDTSFGGGVGLLALDQEGASTVTLSGSTLSGAPLAGAYLQGQGVYQLVDSVISGGEGVDLGGIPIHGEALVVRDGPTPWDGAQGLLLDGTEVRDSRQVGLLLHGASATLSGTTWSGHSTDLIQQGCSGQDTPVGLEEVGTYELCPSRDLPILDLEMDFQIIDALVDI